MFLLKIFLNLLSLGKFLSINVGKVFVTFVAEAGIFRFFVLFFSLFFFSFVHVISNCRFVLYPLFLGLLFMEIINTYIYNFCFYLF